MTPSLRIGAIFAAYFFGLGLFLPFFPLVLAGAGHDAVDIGTLLAVPIVVRLVSNPLMAGVSDRSGMGREALALFSATAFVLFAFLIVPLDFWATFGLLALIAMFWSPILPLSDAFALGEVRSKQADYGRMRLWGSIGFVVANVAGGLTLQYFDASYLIGGIMVGLAAVFALAITMPRSRRGDLQQEETGGNGLAVLRTPAFVIFLLSVGLIQASHSAYYGFGAIFWTRNGISGSELGVLWTVGVVTEIWLFYQSGRLRARLSPLHFLFIGAIAAIVRWTLFPLATDFVSIALLQVLHGLSFGATHLGAVGYVAKVVSARWLGTGQGMSATAIGTVTAIATAACGPLFAYEPATAFYLMAGMALAAILLLVVARRPVVALFEAD